MNIIKLLTICVPTKKNNDKKINFILLKKIGLTTQPNMCKISSTELKKIFNKII